MEEYWILLSQIIYDRLIAQFLTFIIVIISHAYLDLAKSNSSSVLSWECVSLPVDEVLMVPDWLLLPFFGGRRHIDEV